MKAIRKLTIVAWMILLLSHLADGDMRGLAVDFRILYSFDGTNWANPLGGLVLGKDGNFYGTTEYGGTNGGATGFGTVFRVTTDGELSSLVSFNGENGYIPQAPLRLGNDGVLYGTTSNGGTNGGNGTVFKISTNGVLTSLASFQYPDGILPRTGVTLTSDGTIYGTTYSGGTNGYGTVFKLATN